MKSTSLRPELREKIEKWIISFYHLDPRYKILTFFNQVAREGADNFVDEDEAHEYELHRGNQEEKRSSTTEALLRDVFNSSSILTVWRPCSNDAMKKMIEGKGVGKGLDIKGKSAKRGMLSAYVPLMQIHREKDKGVVQPIHFMAKMRIYFSSEESRREAVAKMTPFGRDDITSEDNAVPSKIELLDKYVDDKLFGVELSQRLFWNAYVRDQDISRGVDTETGRPSTPGFQDANFKTLKVACSTVPEPCPMPVVFQYDREQPMRPQTLVMAYEENGTVTPVVSDFDGFLLGWRREALWFGCNLPREQEQLMIWCIDHIESILEERSNDTWTMRWLEVLKKNASDGFIPKIPEYGFGDPKSYSIMEQAALRLIDTGAVRHGSECFNYYFPQEIDDMFLLVSDTLRPVPWRYVDVKELQLILSQKIAEGFVFPLNPKWILCDPGWKKLYDELMASDALYADLSKDVWFPPFSGVRDKIEKISRKHPLGFQRGKGKTASGTGYSPLRRNLERGVFLSGNAAFDLAELELENYTSRKNQLARQIRMATLSEAEFEEGDEEHKPKKDMSRRTMFRLQREERMESGNSQNGSVGKSTQCSPATSSSKLSPTASLGSGIGGGSITPQGTSMRSMYASMHSSSDEPRRNFSEILPPWADSDSD